MENRVRLGGQSQSAQIGPACISTVLLRSAHRTAARLQKRVHRSEAAGI